jgi:hypothetical protein
MVEPTGAGPGRSTADAAFNELKKDIARCNDKAQNAARKSRTARDHHELARRRKWESL